METKDYIINLITNGLNYTLDIFMNEDFEMKYEDMSIHITTTDKMKENELIGETNINFLYCENRLKENYNIDENETLIIFKNEYYFEQFSIPITEYELFSQKYNLKLNLPFCDNIDITVEVPVDIDESEIYKYNPESEYYNNSCYPDEVTSSDCDDKDIINLRKIEFNKNNLSLCEKNCIFKNYDSSTKKVKCQCKAKTTFSSLLNSFNNKDALLFYFNDIYEIIEYTQKESTDLETDDSVIEYSTADNLATEDSTIVNSVIDDSDRIDSIMDDSVIDNSVANTPFIDEKEDVSFKNAIEFYNLFSILLKYNKTDINNLKSLINDYISS